MESVEAGGSARRPPDDAGEESHLSLPPRRPAAGARSGLDGRTRPRPVTTGWPGLASCDCERVPERKGRGDTTVIGGARPWCDGERIDNGQAGLPDEGLG